MPFIKKETTLNISNPVNKLPEEGESLSMVDVIGDAFHIDNPIVGAFKDKDRVKLDTDFDTLSRLEEDNVPPDLWNSFVYVDDEEEYIRMKDSVDNDLKARQRLSEAGISGVIASMVAASASPSSFISGGALINSLSRANKAWKAGAITGSVAATTIFAEEKLLQSTQAGRTDEEVMLNTGVGLLLGGVLGFGAAKISNKRLKQMSGELKGKHAVEETIAKPPESLQEFMQSHESIGAAVSPDGGLKSATKEQLGISKANNVFSQKILDGYIELNKSFNPAVRMMTASSRKARETFLQLAESSINPQAIKEGIAIEEAFESTLKRRYSDYSKEVLEFGKDWKKYKKDGGKLKLTGFREEVGKAFHNDQANPDVNINSSYNKFNKWYEDIAEEAIELDMMPEGIRNSKDGAKYLNTVYATQKIQNDINGFKKAITPWLSQQLDSIRSRLVNTSLEVEGGKPTKEALKAKKDLNANFIKYEKGDPRAGNKNYPSFDTYLKKSVDGVTNNILKNSDIGGFHPITAGVKGPLKKRAFNIPRNQINDWIDNDILGLSSRYARQMIPEIEMRKRFGKDGFEKIIKDVNKEYDELTNAAKPKEAKKLDKERKEVLKDLVTTLDLLRGTYRGSGGSPDDFMSRASRSLLTFNYVVGLGGVAISSIPDAGMGVLRQGFTNFFGHSLKPFVDDLIKTGGKLSRSEARSYGQVLQTVSASRTQSIWSVGDPMTHGTPFERFLGNIGNKMSNYNLINFSNDMWQQVNVLGNRYRIINNISDFTKKGKIVAKEEEFMNNMGFSVETRRGIQNQVDKYVDEIYGNMIPNIDKWDNIDFKNKFKSGIGKAIDQTIITKGATDIPRYGNTDLGRIIFQWQNFNFAFNNKVIIKGLQESDGRVLTGLSSLVSLGMLVEYMKNAQSGRPQPANAAQWVDAGLDRSGILGMLAFGNSYAGIAGLNYKELLGEDHRRAKDPLEVFLGPSGRSITGVGRGLSSLRKEGVTKADVHTGRSLTPGQNIFYLKPIFDKVEESIASGLPETR